MNKVDVVCVGVITMDTVALVARYPAEDERIVAEQIARSIGGPAAIAAVTLARLGISTAIVGTIGDDTDGREVLEKLEQEGINAKGIFITSAPTAGSVIVASREHQSRAISTRQPPAQIVPNAEAVVLVAQAQWVHCDHVGINELTALGISRGLGPKISFDAGYGAENFDASLVDLFVPTDRQMAVRHPEASLADALAKDSNSSKNTVVATRGPDGSAAFSSDDKYVEVDGFNVDVVSTLGAGDVFHGALVAQMVEGRSLSTALRRANAVAALSCRGLDGQSAIPTLSDLETYLKAHQ
ncbi:MAG: carbohydrate kinase family protein [Actinobacteria bacterium]|nr:carbohydrate kinase family protein [Actinomycetota bacterium]